MLRVWRSRWLVFFGLGALLALPAPAQPAEMNWSQVAEQAAELLSGYIQIDTTVPPGNELAGAKYLARFFDAHGIDYQIFEPKPSRGNIVARLPATRPNGEPPLLLLSHIDVVPADPAQWSFPPLSGAIRNGHVYGRGALDDKGHGAVQAMALALLAKSDLPRSRDIVLCASAGEETQGENVGVEWLLEHHADALGPPAFVWNEAGVSTRNPLLGDQVLNAVAVTEKRALWIHLSAEGEGGHGSTPVDGAALDRMVAALERVSQFEPPPRVTPTVDEMFDRLASQTSFPLSLAMRHIENPFVLRIAESLLSQNRVTRAMLHDSIALTGATAGLKVNVIPRSASATLDVRLLPDTDAPSFLAVLEKLIADPTIRIEVEHDPLPEIYPPSPWDHEFFEALEAELAVEIPDSVTVPLQTTGGSDSKFFRAAGIPAYGYMPFLLEPELVSSIHGVDERVSIAELERGVRVTYKVLTRLVTN